MEIGAVSCLSWGVSVHWHLFVGPVPVLGPVGETFGNLLVLVPLLFMIHASKDGWAHFGFRVPDMKRDGPVLALLCGLLLLGYIGWLHAGARAYVPAASRPSDAIGWMPVLVNLLVRGLWFEAVYRGYFVSRVLDLTGSKVVAVLVPSVLYAIAFSDWRVSALMDYAAVGAILALVFLWRRSIWPLIVASMLYEMIVSYGLPSA